VVAVAKKRKRNWTWTKKDYYRYAEHEVDEKILELLVIKILGSKTLSLKDSREFLRFYLRHLSKEFQSYEYIRGKDIALSAVIKETYFPRKKIK
jgi:hypothetical protein